MKVYGIIMAGGGGTRFWPLSRVEKPKQFLNLTGRDLLVNETFDRLIPEIQGQDIFVVTNEKYEESTLQCMEGRVDKKHILAEPEARNTAACIGYAAMEVLKKYGDGILCVVPSDHYIENEEEYRNTLRNAIEVANEKNCLVTIGIVPTYPSTGYGYIKCFSENAKTVDGTSYYKVKEFMEKPDADTAQRYLDSGEYSWNSGMFIFKASVILEAYKKLLPKVYQCLLEIGHAMNTKEEKEVIKKIYPHIPKISIDYGIMEQADEIYMLKGTFGWNDVGSFNELDILYSKDSDGNVSQGESVLVDVHNSIFYGKNRLIAAIGIDNMIFVETEDAVLLCPKDRAQDVKKIVERLSEGNQDKYL